MNKKATHGGAGRGQGPKPADPIAGKKVSLGVSRVAPDVAHLVAKGKPNKVAFVEAAIRAYDAASRTT